ncbi:MAG: NAD-dependent deacetylase [Promethearchaeota archaeon]
MDNRAKAAELIRTAKHLVALTGAGISQESNVPTFRGKDGLWKHYNVMDLATPQAFNRNPELVWEWYAWRQNLIAQCNPNPAHYTLVKWEKNQILKSLITQNVDGLHRKAGSTKVLEVHGNIWSLKCTQCSYHAQITQPAQSLPRCPKCKVNLRPDVVWFGESLPSQIMIQVYTELHNADAILVIGTSALVQPAASFPFLVKRQGGCILEINIEETLLTSAVDIHLSGKAAEILSQLDQLL